MNESNQKLHDIFEKWTPATMSPIQTDAIFREVPDCRVEGDPFPIGTRNGTLVIIGYNVDITAPYIVQCDCGRICVLNGQKFIVNKHCGCLDRGIRLAYLVRLRIEAVRVWFTFIDDWLNDLEAIKAHVMTCLSKGALMINSTRHGRRVTRRGLDENKQRGIIRKPPQDTQNNLLDFLYTISPTPEYVKYLREAVKSLSTDFPAWEMTPLVTMEDFEGCKDAIPEFDQSTFTSLVNFITKNEDNFSHEDRSFKKYQLAESQDKEKLGGLMEVPSYLVQDEGGHHCFVRLGSAKSTTSSTDNPANDNSVSCVWSLSSTYLFDA